MLENRPTITQTTITRAPQLNSCTAQPSTTAPPQDVHKDFDGVQH